MFIPDQPEAAAEKDKSSQIRTPKPCAQSQEPTFKLKREWIMKNIFGYVQKWPIKMSSR